MKLDRFYLNGNEIKLGQLIGKGGEGQVFFVENLIDSVAKIYYPKNIADKQKKSKL